MSDFDIFKSTGYDFKGVVFHVRKVTTMKGDIAKKLVEHFAVVAGIEDGEDSSGRSSYRSPR